MYRGEKKSLQILLSSTQAGPDRKVKQEQEEISRNHVPRLYLGSVRFDANASKPPANLLLLHNLDQRQRSLGSSRISQQPEWCGLWCVMQGSRVRPEGRDKARADLGLIVMPVVRRQEVNRLSDCPLWEMVAEKIIVVTTYLSLA